MCIVVFLHMVCAAVWGVCVYVCNLPINGPVAQVSPEDQLLAKVSIQSHGVPLLLHDLSVLLPLQAEAADVSAVSEDQAGLLT